MSDPPAEIMCALAHRVETAHTDRLNSEDKWIMQMAIRGLTDRSALCSAARLALTTRVCCGTMSMEAYEAANGRDDTHSRLYDETLRLNELLREREVDAPVVVGPFATVAELHAALRELRWQNSECMALSVYGGEVHYIDEGFSLIKRCRDMAAAKYVRWWSDAIIIVVNDMSPLTCATIAVAEGNHRRAILFRGRTELLAEYIPIMEEEGCC